MKYYSILGFAISAVALSVASSQSFAQSNEKSNTSVDDKEKQEASLEVIMVTAERKSSTIQDTPFSLKASSGEQLASEQINDPTRLSNITTGIQLTTVGQQLSLFVRGAGAPVANPRSDPAAAYSIDGVAIARPISVNGAYYDLSRVEVLKGPQGTLYGRNSTIGAVNIISNRPVFRQEGKIEVEAGNYDLIRTEGMFNTALSDTVAVRAAFQTTNRDGYLSNGYNDAENIAGRVRALWDPDSDTSLLVTLSYYKDTGQGPGDIPIASPNGTLLTEDPFLFDDPWFVEEGPVNFASQVPTDGFQDFETTLLSAEYETDVGFATLTLIPALLRTSLATTSYSAGFERRIDIEDKQSSLEFRLSSNSDSALTWILGGLYLDNEQAGFEDLGQAPGVLQRNQFNELGIESYALFGQVTYDITDELRLTGGLRYSNETKTFDGFILNQDINQQPLPGAQPLTSFGDLDFEDVSYRLGVEFDINADSLLYANIATGYKAGGFNLGAPPNTYKPEDMFSVTVGSKNTLLNGRMRLNVEAWYWDYSDVQQVQFGFVNPQPNVALVTFNAAKLESYGIEFDTSFLLGENGTFSADITYINSTWDEFNLPGFSFGPFNIPPSDLSGQDTPFAPKFAVNLAYEHVYGLSNGAYLIANLRTRIRDEQTLNTTGVPGSRVDSTMSSDISLSYETVDGMTTVQAYVNNLEDEPIFTFSGVSPGGLWGSLAAPRTYGVRFSRLF